jgi:phage gpG-like protein
MKVDGRVLGSKELQKKLNAKALLAGGLNPVWSKIAVYMVGSVRKNFAAGGRPRWKESQKMQLTPKDRKEGKLGNKTMHGQRPMLRDSVNARQRGSRRLVIGSNLPYAKIHQYGGKTPAHTIRPVRKQALRWMGPNGHIFAKSVNHPGSVIPARPFIVFHDQDKRYILNKFSQHLRGARA